MFVSGDLSITVTKIDGFFIVEGVHNNWQDKPIKRVFKTWTLAEKFINKQLNGK